MKLDWNRIKTNERFNNVRTSWKTASLGNEDGNMVGWLVSRAAWRTRLAGNAWKLISVVGKRSSPRESPTLLLLEPIPGDNRPSLPIISCSLPLSDRWLLFKKISNCCS